ncbi:MAG: hypothetical protein K2G83_03715 [Ruminococcus sp.]|nr:hypothetical protein [Ruminococcus sp.]
MNGLKETIVKSLKPFVCGLIASTALFGGITAANALSYVKSTEYTIKPYDISFKAYNKVTTGINEYGKSFASAYISINATNTSSLSSGACGVMPKLYYSNGDLAWEDEYWTYCPAGSIGVGKSAMKTGVNTSVAYYAWGKVSVWNGYNYETFSTYRTSNLQDFT